ncbi:MAG: GNAT family N-acetyltransferase [Actinobacteria bacterium]|nr:MAG: GNAT family N-acetyltransferase [Actinomycetota bacterium]
MIRPATPDDLPALQTLWRDFYAEVPEPDYVGVDLDQESAEIEDLVRDEVAILAEEDGELVGFALAEMYSEHLGFVTDLYVSPSARGRGLAADLVRETAARLRERGATHVRLEVMDSNTDARAIYERWGFRPVELKLDVDLDALERRLAGPGRGRSFGSVHVQTDDRAAVERAVAKQLPRLGRSAGTEISEPRNGWIAVYDELADRDPKILQRLARELSLAIAVPTLSIGVEHGEVVRYSLYDRGGAVDEYLSVPEYYGPLPPGDVVALGANPTVLARLTGADPAHIRVVALTGKAPDELPPAEEILRELAAAVGLEGAERGWIES